MISTKNTTYGPSGVSRGKLASIFNDVKFGIVTLRVVDGVVAISAEPQVRYSRKPRSHLTANKRDHPDKPLQSQADAITDLLGDVGLLAGTWEVIVQVASSIPFKWDYEKVRPLQSLITN